MPHDLALVARAIRSVPRGRKQKERLRSHAASTMLCSGACPRSCIGEAQHGKGRNRWRGMRNLVNYGKCSGRR
jgi:formate hydrogenlyase subunit 6/NADH:ubiquinone oxidoreductase subunit I